MIKYIKLLLVSNNNKVICGFFLKLNLKVF